LANRVSFSFYAFARNTRTASKPELG